MDFRSLISDLQRSGLTQGQIASACNCAQTTISDIARGATAEPRFGVGQALVKLHKRRRLTPANTAQAA